MTGADLLTHLQFLGREFLDERRVGWGWQMRTVDAGLIAEIHFLGPAAFRMTLQQAVELFIHVIAYRASMDVELVLLNDFSSDNTERGDFIFRLLRQPKRTEGGQSGSTSAWGMVAPAP